MQLKIHAVLATFLLSGCAGIRMQIPQMTPYTKAAMVERFEEGIPPSLDLPADERQEFAHRAADPIHGAAITMCDRIFGPEQSCASRLSRYRLTVKPHSPVVSAHIDLKNNITVYGGLIRLVGSDDELAAVLAHEYAHGLLGHVRGKMQTIIVGTLVGMAAGAAAGAAASDDPEDVADAAAIGAETGQLVGVRAYSQAMENEADHVGLFILREAGYEMGAASHLHMRFLNAARSASSGKEDPALLYIRTHPGSRERIQKLIGAECMIEAGHLRPLWKR
ncbi:MAG: M48 family metalloprotease [Bryobacterales bacterium]|nr:M48 family metalloprotease [Bryobacterales bacterium]